MARPGVWVCGIVAGNADGLSAIETFTIGIEASSYSQPVDALDVTIELGTGAVTITPSAVTEASANVEPRSWTTESQLRSRLQVLSPAERDEPFFSSVRVMAELLSQITFTLSRAVTSYFQLPFTFPSSPKLSSS